MKINEIIRERRKSLGLTQKNLADHLGVSTPAVNKWEKGQTYPDITILPVLARILETDLNTLLSFNEDLSDREIAEIVNRINLVIESCGISEGHRMIKDKLREYPNSPRLNYSLALSLEGNLIVMEFDSKEFYYGELKSMYEDLSKCGDLEIKSLSLNKLVSIAIEEADYSKAEELLDSMVKTGQNRERLRARLLLKQGRIHEALEVLEKNLLFKVVEIQELLINLIEINIKLDRIDDAEYIAKVHDRTIELYDLWDYISYLGSLELAIYKEDLDSSIELLDRILKSIDSNFNLEDSPLYRDLLTSDFNSGVERSLKAFIIRGLEEDESFKFLREEQTYINLLDKHGNK